MTEVRPAKAGRQTLDGVAVRRVQVMLDDATIERAKALGQGNVSQGIRHAVASLPNDPERDERTPDLFARIAA